MIAKTMMLAGLALATATPAVAQTTQPDANGSMQGGTMQSGSMQSGSMSTGQSNAMMGNSGASMGRMSKSDAAAMKRCHMMSTSAMAKSRKCTMLIQKYPDPSGNSATSPN